MVEVLRERKRCDKCGRFTFLVVGSGLCGACFSSTPTMDLGAKEKRKESEN